MSVSPRRPRAPLFLRLVTPVLRPRKVSKLAVAPQTTFILSTGRTGTVYLADLMNQLPGVLSLHEPKPSRVLIAWTSAFLEGRVSNDYMATALASKRHKTLHGKHAERYIEANNFIAGFADVLQSVFEQPTVIHIVRDPRDYATSVTNRGDSSGLRLFLNRFVPYLSYVPVGLRRSSLTPLTRATYRWAAINAYLNEFGAHHPNYHRFKFEDIFGKQQPAELKRLLKAAGLSAAQIKQLDFETKAAHAQPRFSLLDRPTDSANKSKSVRMAPWREWNQEDCRTLHAICEPLMKTYGYGQEPEWQRVIK